MDALPFGGAEARNESVRVAIRIRPLNDRELGAGASHIWRVEQDGRVIRRTDDAQCSFTFDHVFDESHSTEALYQAIAAPIVNASMQGINGTIFAYGQTSSGKTHTMTGSREAPGVVPYALSDIFQFIADHVDREFLLRVSHLEIYNEVIRDLLNPENTNLKIHESADGNVFVGKLTECNVRSPAEVMTLLLQGQANRQTAATQMNEESSRSHSIFRLAIESRERQREGQTLDEVDGGVQIASLNLVDLAGSERVSSTGSTGLRLKEGGHINKSLLTLGKCIRLLSEGNNNRHIPFRDSKLTRILSSALGGNSSTLIICAVTPASNNFDETISTINFATRAKAVQNSVKKNEVVDEQTLIRRLQKEISMLKSRLRRSDESDDLRAQCDAKTKQLEEVQTQANNLRNLFINANNLDISGLSAYNAPVEHDNTKKSVVRRRRTVDPATFSMPNHSAWGRESFERWKPTPLCAVDEHTELGGARPDSCRNELKSSPDSSLFRESKLDEVRQEADVNQLQHECNTLRHRCSVTDSKLESTTADVRRLTEECDGLRARLLQDRKTAALANAELKQQLERATADATGHTDQISALKCSYETLRHERDGLSAQISDLQSTIQAQLSDISSLKLVAENSTRTHEQEMSRQKYDFEKALQAVNDQAALTVDEVRAELRQQIDDLTSQLNLKASLADANRKLDQLASMSLSKQEQYFRAASERALKQSEKQVEKLQGRIVTLEDSTRQNQKDAIELRAQRGALERQVKTLERQVASRDKELASAKTSQTANATLQKVLKSAEASVSLLQAHCDELKQSNANLLARTSELEQLLSTANGDVERLSAELATLSDDVALKDERIQVLEAKLRDVQSTLDQERVQSEQTTRSLKTELQKTRSDLASVEARLSEVEDRAAEVQHRLVEVNAEAETTARDEASHRKESEERITLLQTENARLQTRVDELANAEIKNQAALREAADRETSTSCELARLRQMLKATETETEGMRKELTAAHDAEHRTGTQSKADKVRIQCITEENEGLRTELSQLKVEHERLREQHDAQLQTLHQSSAMTESLELKVADQAAKIASLSRTNEQLRDDLLKSDDLVSVPASDDRLLALQQQLVEKEGQIQKLRDTMSTKVEKKVSLLMKAFREELNRRENS
ncbi:unnamed protein product (mitochondrion) [Plasmodiophora brassicae]|uniref:Kinesin motor domain-containing protein n=1 Tax=Plasmodiophora brassicae TaxID=37360 RepID=A0A3P3Y863_PLABS|nr:unnamed protein product [Plasmodiophora brassicae]